MIIPVSLDRLPEFAGSIAAKIRRWSPLREHVTMRIEDAVDERLLGCDLTGEVCAYDPTARGTPLLISLDEKLRYEDSRACYSASLVVALAALQWHAPERLLMTWTAVRLIDAPSFADCRLRPTIGTARVTRSGRCRFIAS
jgi:hypothetical protein